MTVTHSPTRNPAEVLNALVAAEIEVIRSRDPELASALEHAPPLGPEPVSQGQEPELAVPHGPVYRSVRKAYRALDRVGALRPLLNPLRLRVLQLRAQRQDRRQPKSLRTATLPRITRSFTIAFTMRSGSNEICNLLAKNGLGSPNEFFQNPLPTNQPGLVLESLARIINQHQVDGIFGSKMSHDHRARLDEQLRSAIPGYSRIDDLFPTTAGFGSYGEIKSFRQSRGAALKPLTSGSPARPMQQNPANMAMIFSTYFLAPC